MTPKEVLYVEDALGHAQFLKTQCQDAVNALMFNQLGRFVTEMASSCHKHYAEDLGYEYLTAASKEEFKQVMEHFVTPEITERPMLFEVFTDKQDESDAIEMLLNMKSDSGTVLKKNLRKVAGQVLGGKGVEALKTILKK